MNKSKTTKSGNPGWKPGVSGNPKGRPKTSVASLVKAHPRAFELVEKLFEVAMDDSDKRQVSAWRLLLPKMVPDLKSTDVKIEKRTIEGVIVLPAKQPLDVSTQVDAESGTFLPVDSSQDGAADA